MINSLKTTLTEISKLEVELETLKEVLKATNSIRIRKEIDKAKKRISGLKRVVWNYSNPAHTTIFQVLFKSQKIVQLGESKITYPNYGKIYYVNIQRDDVEELFRITHPNYIITSIHEISPGIEIKL